MTPMRPGRRARLFVTTLLMPLLLAAALLGGVGTAWAATSASTASAARSSAPAAALAAPAVAIAAKYQGVPYVWGGTTTGGFDCSGYVQYVFRKLGVSLPRTAEQQWAATRHLSRSQLRPGDLVFWGARYAVYHVGIYAGNDAIWNAPHTGSRVQLETIWGGTKQYGRVRGLHTTVPLPVIASASASAPVTVPPTASPLPSSATPDASTTGPTTAAGAGVTTAPVEPVVATASAPVTAAVEDTPLPVAP